MDLVSLLERLTEPDGVSGCERDAADVAVHELEAFCDSVQINKRGTVVGEIHGSGPKILLDAHLDRVGFVITHIEENGFLKFDKCGATDDRILSGLPVKVMGERDVYGVISCVPPHLADPKQAGKIPNISSLSIDTGLTSDDCKKLVSIGDRAVPVSKFTKLLGTKVSSAALDDRSGMAVILRAIDIMHAAFEKTGKKPNVVVTFSVQEEVGGHGAATAAFDADADTAIAVDVSFAHTPGCTAEETGEMGKGPMIGVSPVLSNALSKELIQIAKRKDIPYQYEIMTSRTGTHADEIAVCKSGVKTGLISLPLKYMHTPCEVIDINDLENCAGLIAAYCLSQADVTDSSVSGGDRS